MKTVPVAQKLSAAILAACLAPAVFASSALVISDITYLENGQPVIRPATAAATPEAAPAPVATESAPAEPVATPATASASADAQVQGAPIVVEEINETVTEPAPIVPRIDPGPAVDKSALKAAAVVKPVVTATKGVAPVAKPAAPVAKPVAPVVAAPVVKITAQTEGKSLVKTKVKGGGLNVPPPADSIAVVDSIVSTGVAKVEAAPAVAAKPVVKAADKSLGKLINGVPQIQQRFDARIIAEGAQAAANVQTSPAGIRYLSGGVGIDGRADIARVQNQFSVKLLSAIMTGELLTDVDVAIFTKDGRELLNVNTDGPVLLVDLPAGEYIVRGTFEDQAVQRWIKVVDGNIAVAYFRFDSRFIEGGLPPIK